MSIFWVIGAAKVLQESRRTKRPPADNQPPQSRTDFKPASRPASQGASPKDAVRQQPRLFGDGIFVCYRREDTQGFARSIFDRLERKYGSKKVFRDVDSIPAGVRFPDWIQQKLNLSKIMVVLIGTEWLGMLDEHGRRRLDSSKDWVRQEIHIALLSGIPIIPVLLQGARMPSENELPSSIAKFAEFQSAEVTDSRWDYDMARLIEGIDYLMKLR